MRRAVLAVIAIAACKIPSTLGLPCNEDEHCDAGQFCAADGTCQQGSAPGTDGTSDPSTTTTVSMSTSSSSTTTPPTTESSDPSSTSEVASSSSTGSQCGRAIGTCDAVDVLFVIDNSDSMSEDFGTLLPAFTDFDAIAEAFVQGFCSYHIGVTSTEVAPDYQPLACQVRGALHGSGALAGKAGCWPEDPTHPPWVTEADPLSNLGCLITVGQDYGDDEKQIDTTLAAIGPELAAPGACNEGFLRDDTPLIVVIVSDEDDNDDSMTPGEDPSRTGSTGDPGDWFDWITQIRPARELGVILIGGVQAGGCNWTPLPRTDDGTGAEYPMRLLTFLQYFTGAGYIEHTESANLCGTAADIMMELETFHEVIDAVCQDSM